MLHEFINSRGKYNINGLIIFICFQAVYSVFNGVLLFIFKVDIYGNDFITFGCKFLLIKIAVMFYIVMCVFIMIIMTVGRVLIIIKHKIHQNT